MGNDEHSQNVFRRLARTARIPSRIAIAWRRSFSTSGSVSISHSMTVRTTEPRHKAGVQELVRRMTAAGDIYEGHYEGWYCVGCEAFKQEKDLVGGLCPIHRTKPEWIRRRTISSAFQVWRTALKHFSEHLNLRFPISAAMKSAARRRPRRHLRQSRRPVLGMMPGDHGVMWVDALINYATAVAALDENQFAADGRRLHVIGKDITRFHCVCWPAMLMSAGLAVPKQDVWPRVVHFKGEKMSKSLATADRPGCRTALRTRSVASLPRKRNRVR